LIIGNSAAGISAINTIRKLNKTISLGLIDREDCPAYSRVMTPYYLGKKCSKSDLFIVNKDYYRDKNVDTFFGAVVTNIDINKRVVVLDINRELYFSKLIIATGAEATTINVQSDKSSVLRHMKDAEKLSKLLDRSKSVTAIGAGLVSLPVLSHIYHINREVEENLIVSSNRIFSRVLDEDASLILEKKLIDRGLKIYKNDDIQGYCDNDKLTLNLKSGSTIKTDVLLVGKGVIPNIKIAQEAGIYCHYGILIDDYCMTNVDGVYAAGDVAEGKDFVTQEILIQGNWITAIEQGEIAAKNALGYKVAYEGSIKNNTTEIYGYDVAVVGYYRDDAYKREVFYDELSGKYRKIFLDKDSTIIGVTMIGETNDAGIYYDMIKTRMKIVKRDFVSRFLTYAEKSRLIA
jgi:NAD(P)H-nitrite reductase large subunit